MASSLPIARIGGVDIRAHWSLLVVVALLVWSLTGGVFPEANPGLSDGSYLAMALVAAFLFLLSILLHELGHAVQARREGVPVGGITLWVFGGIAEIRGDMPSPGAEFRIAAAGPAVSLVLGVVCAGLALALPLPSEIDGVLFWCGQINLSLLVFNLIPALPLDGGRMLRAALWARRHDLPSATRTAGALGRGFGQLLIAGGLALAILGGDFSGVWFVFIGWFMLAAAEAELAGTSARAALAGLTVADLMVRTPVTTPASVSVQGFMDQVFLATRHTAYPVLEAGEVVGLVSFRQALDLPPGRWGTTPVREIMTPLPEVTIAATAPLTEALPRLTSGDLRRLLVVHDLQLVGLLSETDVMRVLEVRTRVASAATERHRPQPTAAARPLSSSRWAR